MQRRQFLKTVAAVAMVPQISLRREIDREALLSQFVRHDQWMGRWDLEKPFLYGDLGYATDGRILCRTSLVAPETDGEARLPNVIAAWETYKPVGQWSVEGLPSISELTDKPNEWSCGICPLCDDRRISLGEHYPDFTDPQIKAEVDAMDYDIDDNTVRDPSCPLCHGKNYRGPWTVTYRGVKLSYGYAKKIFTLPGVQLAPAATSHCLLFRADEFEGIAMGLSR